LAKRFAHREGLQCLSVCAHKDVACLEPGFARLTALVGLAGRVSRKGGQRLEIQSDGAPAALGLGLAEAGNAVHRHQGAADGQLTSLHVEIVPAQRQDLAAPHAGHGQQSPEGKETV
jgi:hypothetical protein